MTSELCCITILWDDIECTEDDIERTDVLQRSIALSASLKADHQRRASDRFNKQSVLQIGIILRTGIILRHCCDPIALNVVPEVQDNRVTHSESMHLCHGSSMSLRNRQQATVASKCSLIS